MIEHDLKELDEWSKKWLMSFNPDKTEIILRPVYLEYIAKTINLSWVIDKIIYIKLHRVHLDRLIVVVKPCFIIVIFEKLKFRRTKYSWSIFCCSNWSFACLLQFCLLFWNTILYFVLLWLQEDVYFLLEIHCHMIYNLCFKIYHLEEECS